MDQGLGTVMRILQTEDNSKTPSGHLFPFALKQMFWRQASDEHCRRDEELTGVKRKKNKKTAILCNVGNDIKQGDALDRATVLRKEKLDGACGRGERHPPPRRRCRQGGEALPGCRRPAAKGRRRNRDRIARASLRSPNCFFGLPGQWGRDVRNKAWTQENEQPLNGLGPRNKACVCTLSPIRLCPNISH